jgi:hypothetical protein
MFPVMRLVIRPVMRPGTSGETPVAFPYGLSTISNERVAPGRGISVLSDCLFYLLASRWVRSLSEGVIRH